jgi:hypothetical protein
LNKGCAGVRGGAEVDVDVDTTGAAGAAALRIKLDRSRFMNGFAVGGAGRPDEDKGAPPAMLFDMIGNTKIGIEIKAVRKGVQQLLQSDRGVLTLTFA